MEVKTGSALKHQEMNSLTYHLGLDTDLQAETEYVSS